MRYLLSLSFLLLTFFAATAQQLPGNVKTTTRRYHINETTVIKDSTGKKMELADWQNALRSGEYTLKPEHPADTNTAFIIYKLNAETLAQRKQMLAGFGPAKNGGTDSNGKFTLTEASVVKDSAGRVLPYSVWQPLLANGGYSVRWENPGIDAPVYTLRKISSQLANLQESANTRKPKESNFFTTGQTIEPFRVRDVAGNKILKESWAGKTVVLNFWFIGCPPCRNEMPELNKLVEKYKDNPNVLFIGIALDERWNIKDFIKTNPFNYHLVADGRAIANQFGINLYPTNVVIDKSGKVQFHSSGFGPGVPYWIDKTIAESNALAN